MPPQLKILLPLFAALILIFLVIRHFLIPESFGELGYYRANSIEEIGILPVHYAGKSACVECHETEAEQQASDMHASLSCEICHGPGAEHVDDFENVLGKPGARKDCGRCHNFNSARKIETIIQVNISEHYPEKENCIDCHNPHAVWELKE